MHEAEGGVCSLAAGQSSETNVTLLLLRCHSGLPEIRPLLNKAAVTIALPILNAFLVRGDLLDFLILLSLINSMMRGHGCRKLNGQHRTGRHTSVLSLGGISWIWRQQSEYCAHEVCGCTTRGASLCTP